MSDLDNAINSINASGAKAENTATFLDDMSTFDDQSSVTNPNNGQTVASIPKQVKDRTDELFTAAGSDINQAVSDAAQSATDAQNAADSIGRYQGLWPDTGGSANKGDTYQTQVSGTPTGQYFTALQDTTVDPVGDDVNWRAVVSSDLGSVSNGTKLQHRRGTNTEILAGTPTLAELWLNKSDSTIHIGDGTTQGGIKHINENILGNYTDLVYDSVSDLTALNMSKVKPSSIDANDVQVSVKGYNGTWKEGESEVTRTEYTLTTIQRVRDALGNQTWFPDGVRDFGLYGQNVYIAKVSGSQYSLNTLGVKSGEDITGKLNAALANPDIAANGLEIPSGTFYLSGNINCDFSNPVIKGAGQSLTKLIFTTASGFVFGNVTPVKSIDVSDLSIHTRVQSNSGAAIYANHEIGSRPTSTFRRLFIAGVDANDNLSSGNWFFRGIHTVNAMQPDIDNCRFIGAFATTFAEANRAEAAIKIEATDGAVIPRVTNCWSLNYSRGVMIRSAATPSIEGIYISQCDWVYVNWGVDIEFTSGSYLPPQVNISNIHTEAFYQNIRIKGAKEILVTGCLLYSFNSTEPAQQITIEDSENIRVHGNILVGRPNNTVTEGVRCTNCDIVDVYDNTISTVNTHITATGTTKFMKERGNTFLGSGDETADVTGNTTNKMGRVIILGGDPSYSYYNSEGLLVQGGSVSVNFNSDFGGITFPRAFNQIIKLSVTNGEGAASLIQPVVWSRTNTGANIAVGGLGTQAYRIDWEATGV